MGKLFKNLKNDFDFIPTLVMILVFIICLLTGIVLSLFQSLSSWL